MNIIQTYKGYDIPDICKPMVENIKKLNPNWNYMFFTDYDISQFIKTKTPEYYDTFVKMKYKIQQLDFFRYIVIYFYHPLKNLKSLLFGRLFGGSILSISDLIAVSLSDCARSIRDIGGGGGIVLNQVGVLCLLISPIVLNHLLCLLFSSCSI